MYSHKLILHTFTIFTKKIINRLNENWRNLSIELKYRQQSLAEYIFSQNTDFNYRRVPGIAWNIHGNFLPSLAFILFACKNVASIRNRISVGFKFSTSHFVDGRVFFWFSFLNFERGILQFEAKRRYTDKNLELGWLREQATPAGHASEFICYEATRIRTNRPFAPWHHFTTTTRILQGFAFLCKLSLLFKPLLGLQILIWKEKRKGFWS